jgi:membrane protease YdiL (CAAX protease family)/ribosomal protein S27E
MNPDTPPEKTEGTHTFKCQNCGEEFSSSKKPMFCIVCGQKLTGPSNGQTNSEKIPPETFFCPRCHAPHKFSGNPRFCMNCRYEFIRDATGNLLIDEANYGYMPGANNQSVFPQSTQITYPPYPPYAPYPPYPPYLPMPQGYPAGPNSSTSLGQTAQMGPTGSNPAVPQGYPPYQGYPGPQMYPGYAMPYPPPMYYKPIKPKTWNIGPGLLVPLLTMLGLVGLTLLFALIFLILNPNEDLKIGFLQTFILGSVSLLFFIIPMLWIQRYYPGRKLTFAERLKELGLPLDKYSRIEKVREILFGAVLGVLSVIFVMGFTSFSQWFTKVLFGVDVLTYSNQGLMDQFNLDVKSGWDVLLFVATNLLFVGVPEEIMFRGFTQRCFEAKLKRPAATLLVAIYFALFHIFLYITVPPLFFYLFIPYLLLSIFLGVVRNLRGDLYAVISMHIVYNITQIIIIYFILFSN